MVDAAAILLVVRDAARLRPLIAELIAQRDQLRAAAHAVEAQIQSLAVATSNLAQLEQLAAKVPQQLAAHSSSGKDLSTAEAICLTMMCEPERTWRTGEIQERIDAAGCEFGDSSVRSTLSRFASGCVERIARGAYRLTPEGIERGVQLALRQMDDDGDSMQTNPSRQESNG